MTTSNPVGATNVQERTQAVDVSVLVPARDEAENLAEFVRLCSEAFARTTERYEVIVVDDGSRDATPRLLEELKQTYPFLRSVRHRSARGIADALRTGYLAAAGDVLVFYPADLQFKPEDIPRLTAPVLAGASDMVTGRKEGQYEKAFVSRIYNGLSRLLFDIPVRDLNNVKAYRREIMDSQPVRPDWHRYMIVIAAAQGFSVSEIPVPLYPRQAGKSKFGLSRIPIGVLDMFAVWFELRVSLKPLLAFGLIGAALFFTAAVSGILLLTTDLGTRPLWTVIETALILGSVFFATGLLGEQIATLRAEQRELRRRLDEASSVTKRGA